MFEGGADNFFAAHFFKDFSEACEAETGELEVFGEGAHGHEAYNFEVGQCADLFGEGGDGTDGEAVFLFFLAGIDLEEDFDAVGKSESCGVGVDFFGESERVNGMDGVDDREDGFDLVALEVAYHVPAGFGGWLGLGVGVQVAAGEEFVDHGLTLGELLDA